MVNRCFECEENSKSIIIGIYKITSPSGRIYIGQSRNTSQRAYGYKKLNCKGQTKLCNSINKYGWEAHTFEVIEECEFEDLNRRERYWQDFYDVLNKEKGLNCLLQNCDLQLRVFSAESRKKLSEAMSGEKHRQWGIPIGEYQKSKIKEANSKIILDLTTGIFYDSAKEVSEMFDINYSSLRRWLNTEGKNKTSFIYC